MGVININLKLSIVIVSAIKISEKQLRSFPLLKILNSFQKHSVIKLCKNVKNLTKFPTSTKNVKSSGVGRYYGDNLQSGRCH